MDALDVVIVGANALNSFSLDDALGRLGYQSRVITSEAWFGQTLRSHTSPSIMVLGSVPSQREHLISGLRCRESGPILGVLPCDTCKWDNELLDCFDDFVGWPCHEQELGLRLDRLCSNRFTVAPQAHETERLDAFLEFELIGRSPAFLNVLGLIERVTRCDAPVLIRGETGTGKELCARAIHSLGPRRDAPFIPVNCGSIPDNLLENELFGHDRGAYTDAKHAHAGVVELAQGGTLFLDEVDSLSDKAQVVLLRFTQNQEYRPLGCGNTRQGNVRIVAATNSDLAELVASGSFREDLLYRLNVLPIRMPPLRERSGDIELIAQHILKRCSVLYNQPEKRLDPETLAWMQRYPWPGNVRELENLLQRELLLSEGPFIRFDGSDDSLCKHRGHGMNDRRVTAFQEMKFNEAKALAIAHFEKTYLHWLMAESHGNVSEAARRAGKERRALGKLIKKYNIDRDTFD